MNSKQKLIELKFNQTKKDYPNIPAHCIPITKYTDKTANGLTRMIIDFINLSGGQAERINTTGRMIDNTKIITDVVGFKREIGSREWIKGTGTKGSADISSTIHGKSVKIEVKIGKDRQSDFQKEYENNVTRAGGIYYIAKDFDSFYNWYIEKFNE